MRKIFAIFMIMLLSWGTVFSQKRETYSVRTVVIDPGHGGAKPGAKGSTSYEKDITLAVAKKVGKLIEDNYSDVKVIYTRTTDVDISLADRARLANSNKADLFLSIHANSHPTSAPTGVETFVMGLSESKANLEVARKENADILLEADYKNNKDYSGFDPNSPESYVMLAMFQNSFIDKSLNFAQSIQTQYRQNLRTVNRGVKQAELYVLYKTTCPSVLTEIGFISNPTEEAFMLSDEGQAKIAICLFEAFMTYKATEEGSSKPKNPVYNIRGYVAPGAETPKPTVEKTAPVVAETLPTVVASQPAEVADSVAVVTPDTIEPVAQPAVEEQKVRPVITPSDKPLPAAELPTVQHPEPAIAEKLLPPTNSAAADAQQYYTVQFLVSPTLFNKGAAQLDGVEEFEATRKAQSYVYTTGRFATFKEASSYCDIIHSTTRFKDAWVFLNKQATTPTEQQAKPSTKPSTSGVTYRVQFATATRQMKTGDPDLHGITDFHCTPSGRLFVYSAGDYATLAEARTRCTQIQGSTPFHDAFVIAIYGGQRISLDRAAQLQKGKK